MQDWNACCALLDRYVGIYCIDNGFGRYVGINREKCPEYCASHVVDEQAEDEEFAQLVNAIHSENQNE